MLQESSIFELAFCLAHMAAQLKIAAYLRCSSGFSSPEKLLLNLDESFLFYGLTIFRGSENVYISQADHKWTLLLLPNFLPMGILYGSILFFILPKVSTTRGEVKKWDGD